MSPISSKTSTTLLLTTLVVSTTAFSPSFFNKAKSAQTTSTTKDMSSSIADDERPLFDPLNLYGKNSDERKSGRVQDPSSNSFTTTSDDDEKLVLDPLNLYQDKSQVDARPTNYLNGQLAGDIGFDPLGFSATPDKLAFQRRAELKHARIAMLAAVGWPLSELYQKAWDNIANNINGGLVHYDALLNSGDRVPSVLNGGLGQVSPAFWAGALAFAGVIEIFGSYYEGQGEAGVFDPLSLYPSDLEGQKKIEATEIWNGRLAMMAIVGFAAQEFVTKVGVVNETPFFFHPSF